MTKSQLADAIVAARKSGEQAEAEAPEVPFSRDDAMDIQRLVIERFGSPVIGWKVGAANEAAQAAFGIDSPFYGPMTEASLVKDGGAIAKTPCVGAVEPEYAFKMARDYPAEGEAVNAETVADAVASAHIAIEVIGRCLGGEAFANGVGVTMDFGGNAAFIAGPEIANWRDADLIETPVVASVDGEVAQTGNGMAVMGDPMVSLVWMAQQLADEGRGLKAGEWVSTGTCTPPVPAQAGSTISAQFGELGTVSVRFT